MIITLKSAASHLAGFKYFWAKRVTDFDVSQHCARCLVGPYLKPIHKALHTGQQIIVPTQGQEIIYLCGVSQPFSMARNFHLALQHDDHGFVEKQTYNGYNFVVEGAKELPILADASAEMALPRAYTSCRNFQFGVQYFMRP